MDTTAERLINLVRSSGLVRPRDLAPLGIPRVSLTRAVRHGQLERVGRGLYGLPGREVSAHGSLAEVARRVPKGVVCLLSALRFHDLTTQAPFQVWLAIENKAIAPKLDYPPLRIVRFSGAAFTEGVEEHVVDGVTVRMTGVAKTVADCFKYRNKIGLDVALEALREAWHVTAIPKLVQT
jgi:predicted transcriptional regulator of viral defense system